MLVSFNENEFKLQKMLDRANFTFFEEQLLFITRQLCDEEKTSVIRRSYGTEYHCNTPHKVPCKTAFFRVARRLLATPTRNIPRSGRSGYSNEVTERVAICLHENDYTTVRIDAEELYLGYAIVWKIL